MPYSRYPVSGKDFDDILGFVHVRDLLDVQNPDGMTVADVVRDGISLPGTSKLLPSLALLRKRGIHLATVIELTSTRSSSSETSDSVSFGSKPSRRTMPLVFLPMWPRSSTNTAAPTAL